MIPIKTLVIEDEPRSRNLLKGMIREFCPELSLVGEAEDIDSASKSIREFRPELLFLDVNLFGSPSLSLLDRLGTDQCQVVFTTAYDHYALDAFKYDACDFLLKPIGPSDLKSAVSKVQRRIAGDRGHEHPTMDPDMRRLALPTLHGYVMREVDEILYIKAEGNYSLIHFKGNNSILVSKSIQHFEETLSTDQFFRLHKSYIVNLKEIRKYNKGRGGQVIMDDSTLIPVASRRKEEFLSRIQFL